MSSEEVVVGVNPDVGTFRQIFTEAWRAIIVSEGRIVGAGLGPTKSSAIKRAREEKQ